jgi:hypothetical protein
MLGKNRNKGKKGRERSKGLLYWKREKMRKKAKNEKENPLRLSTAGFL